MSAFHTGKATC